MAPANSFAVRQLDSTQFSYVSCESRVPAGHPLRAVLEVADAALAALSGDFQWRTAWNRDPGSGVISVQSRPARRSSSARPG